MSKPKVAWIRSAALDFWSDNAEISLTTDSLDLVELVMALEEEFNISVEEEELTDVATIGDALTLVESKL